MQTRQRKPTLLFSLLTFCLAMTLLSGCGRDPYDNPIANNSDQPDKILFDKSINEIEKHRYEIGRITLQTLIKTYPDSEYIAKSKLAIADSWYREGTSHALAQAEADQKIEQSKRAVEIQTMRTEAEVQPLLRLAEELEGLKKK
mgnify:CR=1 FL=1